MVLLCVLFLSHRKSSLFGELKKKKLNGKKQPETVKLTKRRLRPAASSHRESERRMAPPPRESAGPRSATTPSKKKRRRREGEGGEEADASVVAPERRERKRGKKKKAAPAPPDAANNAAPNEIAPRMKKPHTPAVQQQQQRRPAFDPADDCETPLEAYKHVAPLLAKLGQRLKKPKDQLRIWDPYYCDGAVSAHLASLGFTNVHNARGEDFYEVLASCDDARLPPHDVIVTNPPFSGDHISRLVQFLSSRGGAVKVESRRPVARKRLVTPPP